MFIANLVRWQGQSGWHITLTVNHGKTACDLGIPLESDAPQYAEIDISTIESFTGICWKCFHEMCIETQDRAMWDIYYTHFPTESRSDAPG